MPIFEKISRLFSHTRSGDVTFSAAELGVSTKTPNFGVTVSNHGAMNITAMYAGIRILSENVASFPKSIKRSTGQGLIDAPEHPAYIVINQRPNPYTNVFDFWNVITTWLNGWGNAFAIIEWDEKMNPVALHQVHPQCVRITTVKGHKYYRVTMADPRFSYLNGLYSDWQMLHFMLITLDGIKGENPIIRNAMALSKNMATEKFASEFYERGGNIKAVMETDGHLGDDDYLAFMKHFKQGSANFDTPLLEYGIKYKQLSVNPVAAQLIQSETLSIQDVCRILNIPPHMIAELSHATYSNIEHQTIQFVQYTMRPMVKRLEVELESKLFLGDDAKFFNVKFNLDGLLRGDTQARSQYYHNAILDGYMNRNEVRELEGLPHKDGLDDFLYPLNTGVVGKENEPE